MNVSAAQKMFNLYILDYCFSGICFINHMSEILLNFKDLRLKSLTFKRAVPV